MESGRTATSAPSGFDDVHGEKLLEEKRKEQGYVPHFFDLVTLIGQASELTRPYIPSIFLEAEFVDSSVLLGHGASFSASRQALSEGEKFIVTNTQMRGWTVTSRKPAPARPRYVVYKTARVAFQANGEPVARDRRALESVLTEFHALIYPPLFNHPNIIDFLGLAWGSNPYNPAHKLPVLVVEYADRGTLADLQKGTNYLQR
jgi:hypothetical protein